MRLELKLRKCDCITFEGMDYEAKKDNYGKDLAIVEMRWHPGYIGQIYIGRGAIARRGSPIYRNTGLPGFIKMYRNYTEAIQPSLRLRGLLLVIEPRR